VIEPSKALNLGRVETSISTLRTWGTCELVRRVGGWKRLTLTMRSSSLTAMTTFVYVLESIYNGYDYTSSEVEGVFPDPEDAMKAAEDFWDINVPPTWTEHDWGWTAHLNDSELLSVTTTVLQ
jgi:hypothetical protein